MAVDVRTNAQLYAHTAPSSSAKEEDEALYTQLLRIRDAVISGRHPRFTLPSTVIEKLKVRGSPTALAHASANGALNGAAFHANRTTNHAQPSPAPSAPAFGLPGLHAASASHMNGVAQRVAAKPSLASGLDPIFLEKSDSLVRAEGQLKRQRIERELQAQVEQRKQSSQTRDSDAPSSLDIAAVLANAFARVSHVSGLRTVAKAGSVASSSFDENDYYSSQAESAWSSPASANKASDSAAGVHSASAGGNDTHSAPSAVSAQPSVSAKQPVVARNAYSQASKDHPFSHSTQNQDVVEIDDEDDEYIPPDATEYDSLAHVPPLDDDDDNSEYEPGEITQESVAPTPYFQAQQSAHSSPHVPIIRNHLTHIAAPQPNRVSPLAVAKGPSIELELVNGRPEIVQKARPAQSIVPSRVSTASPSGNGAGGSGKKRRQKKRKRDSEPSSKTKKKRDRHNNARSPPSPAHREPHIKAEPVSPQPLTNVPDLPQFVQRPPTHRPAEIEMIPPRHAPQTQYIEPSRSGLRYEYAHPASPAIVRLGSPAAHRPAQRDSQDLRRVASMHYAQRPPSPTHRVSSPVPFRTVSATYSDPHLAQVPTAPFQLQAPRYQEQPAVQYVRADHSRSPPRLQEYHDTSPGIMPPPSAPPRQIVVDQYGNRYYAADPALAPPRASVAPIDRRPPIELGYERAPSRMASMYAQPSNSQYEHVAEVRMAPPPPPLRRQISDDQQVQYVDAHGYPIREHSMRPVEQQQQIRYIGAPASPVYQAAPRYDQMAPPALPAREPTSPMYAPRSYSVRPEQAAAAYGRQASVAPVQYVETVAPPRPFSHAPQQVRYVDQYGREVIQGPAPEYRYQ